MEKGNNILNKINLQSFSSFFLYKLFILSREDLIKRLLAKNYICLQEIKKSPNGKPFLEYLLEFVPQNQPEYQEICRLIKIRFLIVEKFFQTIESFVYTLDKLDPSSVSSLILKKKLEQAIDRCSSSSLLKESLFRKRILKDFYRTFNKTYSYSKKVSLLSSFQKDEGEDEKNLDDFIFSSLTSYNFATASSPEDILLAKEAVHQFLQNEASSCTEGIDSRKSSKGQKRWKIKLKKKKN